MASCEFECNGFKHDAILKIKIKMRMVLMFAAFSSLLFREKRTGREQSVPRKKTPHIYSILRERGKSLLYEFFLVKKVTQD